MGGIALRETGGEFLHSACYIQREGKKGGCSVVLFIVNPSLCHPPKFSESY